MPGGAGDFPQLRDAYLSHRSPALHLVGSCLLPARVGPKLNVQRASSHRQKPPQPSPAPRSGSTQLTGLEPRNPKQGRFTTTDPLGTELQCEALPLTHQMCSSPAPTLLEGRERDPSGKYPLSTALQSVLAHRKCRYHRRAPEVHHPTHCHDSAQGQKDTLQQVPRSYRVPGAELDI